MSEDTNPLAGLDLSKILIDPNSPSTPAEREAAAKARLEAESGIAEGKLDLLSELALNPKKGDPFILGGRTFNLAFVGIDTEQAIMGMLVDVIKASADGDMADALIAALPELTEIAATILADETYLGGNQPDAAQWIRSRRGDVRCTTGDLLNLVLKQAALQEVGQTLGKLLMPASLAGILQKVGNFPGASAALISSIGDAPGTAKAQGS